LHQKDETVHPGDGTGHVKDAIFHLKDAVSRFGDKKRSPASETGREKRSAPKRWPQQMIMIQLFPA